MAKTKIITSSAELVRPIIKNSTDFRKQKLKVFFQSYNSPLSLYSEEFVDYADKYNLDWRIVPAITGVESSFGKRFPKNSFNVYGWANGEYKFNSWEEGIETVSRILREKYYDKGATTIEEIAKKYAPPSKTWAYKVRYFMDKIDSTPLEFDL